MRLRQTLKIVWANISGNRMRTFLTMLGMIIGVSSVIILVSLMQGYLDNMISSYSDLGINNIEVTLNGRNGNLILSEEDMYHYASKHSDKLSGVTPKINLQSVVSKNSLKEEYAQIIGVDENYLNSTNTKLDSGHSFTYSDLVIRQKVCVIGSYLNMLLFGGNASSGDTLSINGEKVTIIGILTQTSDSTQWSNDNILYLPYTTAMKLSGTGKVNSYTFMVRNSDDVAPQTTLLQSYLFKTYQNSKAFKVTNLSELLKSSKEQMAIITSAIAGIAGISLVVAGIGIMNIMLVSVSERTREIGIRKSLGATYKDIMSQFILEAATTSTIGGLIGLLLGSFATVKAGELINIKASPNLQIVLISLGVSIITGILFGYLPARKAARLNPIDALRSE
ncbi:MAG TPA: ABC transporter permease [Lachnospiraceae bacterium]|nr:ABC transporter permease [Lachnospiraceae bacterium]